MNKRTPVPGYRLLSSPSTKLTLKDNHSLTPCINSQHQDYFSFIYCQCSECSIKNHSNQQPLPRLHEARLGLSSSQRPISLEVAGNSELVLCTVHRDISKKVDHER